MGLLNPPETLPQVMFLVHDYLRLAPKHTENAEKLRDLLAPRALTGWKTKEDEGDGPEQGASVPRHQRIVQIAMKALCAIGIAEETGDELRLTSPSPRGSLDRVAGPARFKRMLRARIFDPEANRNLWSEEGEKIGSRDLTRALAWWLVQDIFNPVGPWTDTSPRGVQYRQRQQFGEEQKAWIFSNGTRWDALVRWAIYLGFAWRFGYKFTGAKQMLLVPDPTEAVRDTLPLVFGRNGTLTMPEFLESLAERLPVLDGGVHRQAVLDRVKGGSVSVAAEDALTTSLAHVLLRLDQEQVIELRNESDTTKRLFPVETGRALPFSHIRLLASDGGTE